MLKAILDMLGMGSKKTEPPTPAPKTKAPEVRPTESGTSDVEEAGVSLGGDIGEFYRGLTEET